MTDQGCKKQRFTWKKSAEFTKSQFSPASWCSAGKTWHSSSGRALLMRKFLKFAELSSKSLSTYQQDRIFETLCFFAPSIYTLYFVMYQYLLFFRSSATCPSLIVEINSDNFKQSSIQHVCTWISREGRSWECTHHTKKYPHFFRSRQKFIFVPV